MISTDRASIRRGYHDLELVNHRDSILAELGSLPRSRVRRLGIRGVIDTSNSHLVIPWRLAAALGAPIIGETGVRRGDPFRMPRHIVGDVEVQLLCRSGTFKAIVDPDRETALIGLIVLEELDFIAPDCHFIE